MNTLKLFAFALLIVCFASCGNKNSVTLKIEPQLGELGQYISISDDDVVIELDETSKEVVASLHIQIDKTFAAENTIYLDVIVLDKAGNEIAELPNFEIEESKYEEPDNGGYSYIFYKGTIRAQMKDNETKNWLKHDWVDICKEGVSIIVKSNYNNYKEYSNNTESLSLDNDSISDNDFSENSDNNKISNGSGSEDWDALLNSYEQLVDRYIYYAKKAANGDMDALTEYSSFMQKAQELSSKMLDAKDKMSASQISRYMNITAKLNKLASELQ